MLEVFFNFPIRLKMEPRGGVQTIAALFVGTVACCANLFIWSKVIQLFANAVKLGLQ